MNFGFFLASRQGCVGFGEGFRDCAPSSWAAFLSSCKKLVKTVPYILAARGVRALVLHFLSMMEKGSFLPSVLNRLSLLAGDGLCLWLAAALILACWGAGAQARLLSPGERPGYLDSVSEERHSRVVELVVTSPPPAEDSSPLHERIFNDQLSREFQVQYEQRFGHTQAERQLLTPNRFAEYEYSSLLSVSFAEDQENKRRFGDYMMKRLVEYHVDAYAKSNPSVRPVYELKDRVANVDLELRQGFKFRFRYSYSGNYLDIFVENPYQVDTRFSLIMDPDRFGPSRVEDGVLSFRYPLERNLTLSYHYKLQRGVWSLVGERRLSPQWTASLSGSTYAEGENGEDIRQNLVLLGLSWVH